MYCPTCGSDSKSDVRFCRRCGTSLEAVFLALSGNVEERAQEQSQLSQLVKDYYSGRHEMMSGLGAVAVGIAVPATFLVMGWWGFFWIFVWFAMGIFGNGIHQFNKGWKKRSEATCDLKILGYDGPPTHEAFKVSQLPAASPSKLRESPGTEPLPLSATEAPPSVTESTTRRLDKIIEP